MLPYETAMFSLTSMPWWRRWFGSRSEKAATRFLRDKGCRIVVQNWSCPIGELDVVALDGDCLVFVEVRSTEGTDHTRPALSVDLAKQRKLTKLALCYLQKYRLLNQNARFDVLTVSWPAEASEPTIVHYPHAFEATERFQMHA